MKIESKVIDGEAVIVLSEVYSGVGIETELGLFGIAQRDDGIEVRLDGKTVWTSHEIPTGVVGPIMGPLPDGSGFFTASFPLPRTHWIYAEGPNEPPLPVHDGDCLRASKITEAARYAVRCATMNGKEKDFDPDAIVQAMLVGLLGPRQISKQRGSL